MATAGVVTVIAVIGTANDPLSGSSGLGEAALLRYAYGIGSKRIPSRVSGARCLS